ncbi:MAG TPA: coproporphyrinogen III oxidase [Actinomycetales bacterium]|nr:coproporphyrinogen III oxidase [Actinomycetales bacterium]
MPTLPDGDPVPTAGPLAGVRGRVPSGDGGAPFGLYVHVPFCRVRCGYCDFNTYTSAELGGGASQAGYADTALLEVRMAAAALREAGLPERELATVFFGGGTPTILPTGDLARMLEAARTQWGLAAGAEVTTEANPDTLDGEYAAALARAGFTRVSIGMLSAVPHVLATLERTHDPAGVAAAVGAVRTAGLDVSVDLIYGTPGESVDDWKRSVDAALALEPDHVSAYALGIEPGTKMGAQLRRGLIPPPDPDDQAAKYEYADTAFEQAGYPWYEISNWARPGHECRHNLAYWRGGDWWGIGPGAHSHVAGVRFWNVKHPRAYADRLANDQWPALAREVLTEEEREFERVMLEVRLREGIALETFPREREVEAAVGEMVVEGWLERDAAARGRVVLTRTGRLMADAVTRALTD